MRKNLEITDAYKNVPKDGWHWPTTGPAAYDAPTSTFEVCNLAGPTIPQLSAKINEFCERMKSQGIHEFEIRLLDNRAWALNDKVYHKPPELQKRALV